MTFEHASVADIEKLAPLTCEVMWCVAPGLAWERCTNPAAWTGIGHDEDDCTAPDGPMIVCDSCYRQSQLLQIGQCGHELYRDARPL